MTPEGKVKKEIKQYLDSIGAYYFMPVQMGYGAKTLDFLCCIKGRFVAIEAKAMGREPTNFQKQTIQEIQQTDAFVFIITEFDDIRRMDNTLKAARILSARLL